MKQKILMVGTPPPPFQGQPIAFASAVEAVKDDFDYRILHTSFQSGNVIGAIFKLLKYYILLPYYLVSFRPKKVYFLCSRSVVGGFRDIYLIILCYFTSIRLYNHLHGSDFNVYVESLPWIYKRIVQFLFQRVDRHAVLVKGMEEQLYSVSDSSKIQIIHNFYEDYDSKKYEREIRSTDVVNLLFLSSIVKTKGIFELIYAFKKLKEQKFKVHLYICGGFLSDNEMNKKEVQEKFSSLVTDVEDITYLGAVDKQKKYEVLNRSHIFVLPTYYSSEAVPLSIIEAMSSGCAIVTTNYRYLPNIVQSKVNGDLVKVRSTDDLVSKLEYLISNKCVLKKISKTNKDIATDMYSEKNYQQNIRNFLEG